VLVSPPLSVRTAEAVYVPALLYVCDVATLTELVPIPPDVVISPLIPPSPKLKLTLLIVPSASVPLAVNVMENGVVPVVDRSTVRLLQTGAWFALDDPEGVGEMVRETEGVTVGVEASVGVATAMVGVAVSRVVGVKIPVGMGIGDALGVVLPSAITIVAGVVEERTFSLAWSPDPIERTWVVMP